MCKKVPRKVHPNTEDSRTRRLLETVHTERILEDVQHLRYFCDENFLAVLFDVDLYVEALL